MTNIMNAPLTRLGGAVLKAAIAAFDRGETGNITLEDLIYQRSQFMPANLANPKQIAAIRRHSRYEPKAASDDNSIFRFRKVESFSRLLED
ncbi:MAG: hypothetical protein HC852_22635 [Acaryochloridaceae cyanobacterium RU_4_10]|nr:hypothetical protein [Acaryochloridaceae cyanobacterium RU_4_10]